MIALWGGLPTRDLVRVVGALKARGASRYWVVGYNESVPVARALATAGARVHLTIQDDTPYGVFGRSRRYRPLAPLVSPVFDATLRRVASIDVVSDGMRRYYAERLSLDSVVVRPYIASLPPAPPRPAPGAEIRIGHIGTIYAVDEWRAMLVALRTVAAERGVAAKMVMIGLAARYHALAAEFPDCVELVEEMPDDLAVERLFTCQVVYAMYPFDARSDVFRRTSLPTKVNSYVKAQRPILAHAPAGSTLFELVERYAIGVPCTSSAPTALAEALRRALLHEPPAGAYEKARAEVYGADNARRLGACLDAL